MMSYLEELSQMDLVSCRDRFFELCDSPAQAQECVLLDMVSRNADTEFGRLHGFADIHSVEEYRNRLPVSDWNSFEPYSNQMQEGAQDVLFSGAPNMFLLSSGTTGKTKYIPESAEGARAKEVTSKLRRLLMIPHLFAIPNFCFLPFSNRAVLNRTPAGIPACTASGVTLMSTPPDIRERIAFPLDVLRCDDPGALDYLAMRFALEKDVNMIVGNNPVRMAQFFAMADARKEELLEDIARGVVGGQIAIEESLRAQLETRCGAPNPERARELAALAERRGCLAPRDYWPGLRVASCWLSGSVGGHVTSLHPWVGDAIQFLDCGYGASEGKFNEIGRASCRERV